MTNKKTTFTSANNFVKTSVNFVIPIAIKLINVYWLNAIQSNLAIQFSHSFFFCFFKIIFWRLYIFHIHFPLFFFFFFLCHFFFIFPLCSLYSFSHRSLLLFFSSLFSFTLSLSLSKFYLITFFQAFYFFFRCLLEMSRHAGVKTFALECPTRDEIVSKNRHQ